MGISQLPEQKTERGSISRRRFIGAISAAGLAAALPGVFFAETAHAAEAPKHGGRFRIGLSGGSTTDSLDPALITDTMARVLIFGTLGNNLVETDADNRAVPELAESLEAAPGAAKWVVKLRKGVEFHNGKSLDADDVIYSINHHRAKGSKSGAKGIVKAITNISKEDKYTVIFELDGGNADFPYLLSDYHLVIIPNNSDPQAGVFTGGYIIDTFEPGVRAFARRNPNYFKSNRGWFDEVEILVINDVNARTNALKTGQVDAINRCDLKTVHLLKRIKGIEIMRQDGFKHYTFAMRINQPPYNSKDVRLALKYAVDRKQMVNTILRGYGSVGNDHPISPANRYHAAALPQRQYDPDRARFHLKKAGLEKAEFNFHAADAAFVGAVDAGVLYREQAARAGININVIREPNDGYWSNIWMKKPFCPVYWGGRPTEDMMFATAYASNAPWNDTGWTNKKFNQLLLAARSELDEDKRRAIYADMQELCRDDGGTIVPMFAADIAACNGKVGHQKLAVNWEVDGNKSPERWWFK